MVTDPPVAALGEHATSIPRVGSEASPSLPRSFGNARVVGLGEATHGTRECFEHKRRLIQYLVTERGFRTVAFEADAAAATVLDAYVRDGNGFSEPPADPASALAELDMWQWRTESVAELLAWLRTFNDGREPEDRVRVRGVDLSTPSAPAEPLRAYLETVDPDAVESERFRTVTGTVVPDDADRRERVLDDVIAAATRLADRLDAGVPATESRQTARHLCRVVEQAAEWARVRHEHPGPHAAGMAARDRFVAENVRRAWERDPGSGVAFWAHDAHVQRGTFDDGTAWADATTAGERLAREFGDDYQPVGFDVRSGAFRAVGRESGEVETFSVDDPRDDSATAAFARVDDPPFMLDLAAVADDGRIAGWLATPRRKRYVGSVFDPAGGEWESDASTDLPASFDWLLFLPESTPTRPIDDSRRQNP